MDPQAMADYAASVAEAAAVVDSGEQTEESLVQLSSRPPSRSFVQIKSVDQQQSQG